MKRRGLYAWFKKNKYLSCQHCCKERSKSGITQRNLYLLSGFFDRAAYLSGVSFVHWLFFARYSILPFVFCCFFNVSFYRRWISCQFGLALHVTFVYGIFFRLGSDSIPLCSMEGSTVSPAPAILCRHCQSFFTTSGSRSQEQKNIGFPKKNVKEKATHLPPSLFTACRDILLYKVGKLL